MDSSTTTTTTSTRPTMFQWLVHSILLLVILQFFTKVIQEAYQIRLYALQEYGRVIHEFDPYFNYRATEYLYEHGWKAFKEWFDYQVWYPLGRPVGTTIYPGMQVTSVFLKQYVLPDWSVNDICCFVPAWFGSLATLGVAWLTYICVAETTVTSSNNNKSSFGSILNDIPFVRNGYKLLILPLVDWLVSFLVQKTKSDWGCLQTSRKVSFLTPLCCALAAAAIMSVIPAHIMRSVGGGYDNESVAMTAMVVTFACWAKSLQDTTKLSTTALWGVITGVAYFYMVAAWGGYVFVLNVIVAHAGSLVLLGRYSKKLHVAYSAFFIVGTGLAIQVPVVGWTPLKSLEQLGAFVGFGGLQLLALTEWLQEREEAKLQQQSSKKKGGGPKKLTSLQVWKLRLTVFLAAGAVAAVIVMTLLPKGYFGPISSRVRGLFVKHTKTGNPLVDSVAEHQAANPQAYQQYLGEVCKLVPIGFLMTALFFFNDSSSFLVVYGMAAYFFSLRMVRLILLTAPIASIFGGIVIGRVAVWIISSIVDPVDVSSLFAAPSSPSTEETESSEKKSTTNSRRKTKDKSKDDTTEVKTTKTSKLGTTKDPIAIQGIRLVLSAILVVRFLAQASLFWDYSHEMAHRLSVPTIIQKGRLQDGSTVMVDDYRAAYLWLKDNTPEDARIMAWWDYGYQITAIADRTTIADGNTWNHEHIAFLGRTLTSSEKEAHRIARHLADYVLVWAGGGGDDLAKSPHLRRIANSVYRGLCSEPLCREFGFYSDKRPTPLMEESLLYKLVRNGLTPGVTVDPNRFAEVYRSQYGKVRIYKIKSVSEESKRWVADPANRVCDAPGSWVCRGQYPPALTKILQEKKDFRQLEDFNREDEEDEEYQRAYMENLMKPHHGGHKPETPKSTEKQQARKPAPKLSAEDIDMINENWENTERTTLMWQLISQGHTDKLREVFEIAPDVAHIRSEDGRGPMWWAYEYGHDDIIELLKSQGVSDTRTDEKGISPIQMVASKE